MILDGITAPAAVDEGSTQPIDVQASGSTSLVIVDSSTGDRFTVKVDDKGNARFELPITALAGTTLLVVDENDPTKSATILVNPPLI